MKYFALSMLLFCLFFSRSLSAQKYSTMPVNIQQKMDQNKIDRVNIYSGIKSTINVEVANLLNKDIAPLISKLQNDPRIKFASFKDDGINLTIVADGSFNIKDVKAHIITVSASIENYTINYEISQ